MDMLYGTVNVNAETIQMWSEANLQMGTREVVVVWIVKFRQHGLSE